MKKFLLSLAAFTGIALPTLAATETLDFTFNQDLGPTDYYGFNKLMSYDVAIKIADPVLTGAQVTGLRVDFPVDAADVTDMTGWMSTELRAVNNKSASLVFGEASGVVEINSDVEVMSVSYYDRQGRPVANPASGLYIKEEKLSDGATRHTKTLLKD